MKSIARWTDALAALVLTGWFFLPVAAGPARQGLTGTELMTLLGSRPNDGWALALTFLVWLVPLAALFRIVVLFLPDTWEVARPNGWTASVVKLVSGGALVLGSTLPFLLWGDSATWFKAVPVTGWLWLMAGAAFHVWGAIGLLSLVENRDPRLKEYLEFGLTKIRSKLLASFIGLITVVVVVLSTLMLSNDERTILKAVGDGARAQVRQAATVYKANLGTEIAMYDYLNGQAKVNADAAFPFRTFSFYTNLDSRYLLDEPDKGSFPGLRTEFSSDHPDVRFPPEAAPELAEAKNLLAQGATSGVHDLADRTFLFAAPIVVNDFEKVGATKVRHDRFLGLAVLTFDEDVVLAPFVRTQTSVVFLTLLFLYLSVVMVYLVGTFIVTPLLNLRMNVRTVSDALTTMVRGQVRVSAAHLRFDPAIKTRDEIESLSGEIGSMVTVIRGIIPYISASTLQQSDQEASSKVANLTFLFTDIRGFTTLCEGMNPEEVVTLLNRYLDLETEIILANHGDVDKFVGDEVMAFFDGPDQESNACRAAIQLRRAMYEEKALREKDGLKAVEIGIGIHSGSVVFGSVGARDRRDFTSIGDPVNLAARLEGANKFYGSKILISEAVHRRVQGQVVCRELDSIAVKGKTEPVRIFELLQEAATKSPKVTALAKEFEEGLKAYRAKDWSLAQKVFQKVATEYEDGPSHVFLERSKQFEAAPPPADWDGVYRSDSK